MPKIIKNNRVQTWEINGDSQTWTLEKQASITVHDAPAIDVLDTSVANRLKLLGDIVATGEGGQGVLVSGVNTRILVGKDADINAQDGIHAAANGLDIVNRGEIDGMDAGIINSAASTIRNFGEISGNVAITTLGTSKVINGENGVIQGDFVGVSMTFGSDSVLINKGMISGNEFAVRLTNGGETRLVNTGTIHGDIEFSTGDDLLDSMKGILDGTVTGGSGDDTYRIGANDVMIIEDADDGIDRVVSTISRELGSHIENLTLAGKKNIAGAGNDEDNVLVGNLGRNTLQGGEGDDEIGGGRGDDALMGGDGADSFIFRFGDDRDIITDFVKGDDTISLIGFKNADSFEELQTEMFKNGSDVWIQLGNGDRLIILNTDLGDLEAADFNFVA